MARLAPDEVLARVFGLLESLVALGVGLGALVASLLIDLASVRVALVAVGAICPILAAAAWRRLRHLDRDIGVLDEEIELLHGVPMLKPLPLPAIEQLARGLEPVHVPAGQAVFRQGDPADRFYVIETGAADVVGDGRLISDARSRGWVRRDRAVAQSAAYGHGSGGQRPSVAGAEVRPLPSGRHGVPAERAGGGVRGRGDARPVQPG